MTCKRVTAAFLLVLALASCGGPEKLDPPNSSNDSDDEGYFLRSLRNPCNLLTVERATEILGVDASSDGGRASFMMASCAYSAPGNKDLNISIMMHGSHLLDSRTMSEEQMLTQFKLVYDDDAERKSADVSFGNGAFYAHTQDGTQLVVATGISGTAMTSDRPSGEAAMYLFLRDAGMDPNTRLDALKMVAENEFRAMDEIAQTTHE